MKREVVMKRKATKRANPFYVLLVLVGLTFLVTACAYGVMAFTDVAVSASGEQLSPNGLNAFMDRHGMVTLLVQVVLLGLFAVAAMGTDEYWQRVDARSDQPADETNKSDETHKSDDHSNSER